MLPRLNQPEWTRFHRLRGVSGAAALHARFVAHRYARHAHEYAVIGLVESGVQSFAYRGSRHITPAGRIFVVNPDEPHTGEAVSSTGYVYRTLYLDEALLTRTMSELRGPASRSTLIRGAVLEHPALAASLARLHRALARAAPALEQESLLLSALTLLLTQHAVVPRAAPRAGREPAAVATARDYINTHFNEDVSLSQLARLARLSPWYFARVFEKAVGLPPHAYLDGVRISHARALLDSGQSIAAAASCAGYADQSHLTKRFRRLLGITPGQYIRQRVSRC
ncbi:MAG TPA: AraC family transcriptional regulator [Steroidobacteraceae bacterium]